jgi:hypothetical protein
MDMREALEKAFDKSEDKEPPEPEKEEPKETPYEVEAKASETDAEVPEKEVEKPEAKEPEAKEAAPPPPPQEEVEPAPVSWKTEEKAQWAKIPKAARDAIHRREREISQTLNGTSGVRKFANEFAGIVQPYSHLIRAQNSTPLQAVDSLFRTAAGLTIGDQAQKARIIANIISNYGVDIATLDKILSEEPTPPTGNASMNPEISNALAPVYDFMNEIKSMREQASQRMQQNADQTIHDFGKGKPHFEEVREEMADLMEVALGRGRKLTLQQAYDYAINANPTYAKKKTPTTPPQDLEKARRRASSVAGAPSTAAEKGRAKTMRGQLEEAWEHHTD